MDLEPEPLFPMPGFRLSKFEVYNWGTFDGSVYSVLPNGQTTLLIGENGSGKSTLVDALLTLLVRPQTRNYNVAAGATKNERDERTYIRGAYDRTVGEGGRPRIQYLRSGQGHYTALLACFENASRRTKFTVCQVLYLDHENNVEKIYAFADSERGIVQDLGDLTSTSGLAKQLRDRGFKTSTSYKEYFHWLQKTTGFRAKAMDIFNQTVAVKDVQRLDVFIRQHMLEKKPWDERVGQLLKHFSELSDAHRMLVRVRQQEELLSPIVSEGKRYRTKQDEVVVARRQLDATQLFFAQEQVILLEPWCDRWRQEIQHWIDEIDRLGALKQRLDSEIARIEIEIEHAGGDRLRSLPGLIEQEEQIAKVKATQRNRFEAQLQMAGIRGKLTSPDQFHKIRHELTERRRTVLDERDRLRASSHAIQFEIGDLTRRISEDRREFEALERRRGNLPESFISVRESICRDLKLAPSDLPFAAELIAVNPLEREWEASIEQALYAFSRSLLVSGDFYARVAGYVDRTRLVDGRGLGQRLVYLKVGTRSEDFKLEGSNLSKKPMLIDKLEIKTDHPLARWIRSEIEQRFNYLACESVENFQRAQGAAMTKNRHLKTAQSRHEKDDRGAPDDRRNFVLGWDNKAKRSTLADAIRNAEVDLQNLQDRSNHLSVQIDSLSTAIGAIDEATKTSDFDDINNDRHEFRAAELRIEKQRLEESNDTVRDLRKKAKQLRLESEGHQSDRDECIAKKTNRENELRSGQSILTNASGSLRKAESDGRLETARAEFDDLKSLVNQSLTLDNMGTLPEAFERRQRGRFDSLEDQLKPIARDLTNAMVKYLRKFQEEQSDLDANIESLSSFEALHQRIAADDLPKHEERFKSRLNEKVLHEIGLLNGGLETDRQEIRDKIEQLNEALKLLQWKPGTFMQLEPSDVQDREILDFRRELAGCLTGTFDATPEANEATFVRIEKLVEKLRDENNHRWREKVVDVRNWFNFAAREIVQETGEVRSYYEGGTGQSGGEKGKLAFLVLVAAIAYQYDLEPDAESSDRFHFVMVDEMFSRSDDQHAEYALELFERFRLQLLIVAPLDAKARVTEPYVGTYLHVVKNKETHRSELLAITAKELHESLEAAE
ncbi:MAG: ATP-binding protein [Pirellulaceae bacterium]|nr:ATP-binding protein [Pirellulaceae bacterium]